MRSSASVDTVVLVVGAGPTGLMLANQLVRRGVRTLIIDRHAGPARETRALGVQARTLEIYAQLGIVDQALELGTRATGASMWASGKRVARVPLGEIGRGMSPYPYLLILGQDDNERLLGQSLNQKGLSVQWNTELVGLAQQSDRVAASVRNSDGTTRELTTSWMGGCDGARSIVRETSGIAFEGAPYEHVFFVADTQVTGPMSPGELNVYLWRGGFHLFFPMRGTDHWRVVGILPPELRSRDDVTLDNVAPAIRAEAGAGVEFQKCSWFSTYRIHHRRAERFRDRRCFLMGDAAHIHSPVGAQGMNTGLQDAYNLAWKLALVTSGRADAALLDSYEAERIPVASRLLSSTDRAFSAIVSHNPLAVLFRTRVFPGVLSLAMHVDKLRKTAFRTISQTGIRYRQSPVSEALPGLPEEAPRAGDRFPWLSLKLSPNAPAEDFFRKLDDTRFTLLLIGQPAPRDGVGLGDILRTHVIPHDPANDKELDRVGIPHLAFYLVRPDGYIGLSGVRLEAEAVNRYIAERLSIKPT
jgi:2-polyprenyl-6-methoxyphenol hydroxylase-like FAD-dependent oxidoreductase